jgi:2-polyprenyl-6-methoxyphenol hydroxylase-like FAD-dependent oxidoreductase
MPDWTHTIVESYGGGWAWSVPISETRRHVTVMVDPAAARQTRITRLDDVYRAQLAQTHRLRELVRGAVMTGASWARDASPYTAARFAEPGVLLVGDAASFVDPLSSYGVKKALASAWLASVVTDSTLWNASIMAPALELFESRERAMYRHLQRRAASLAREAGDQHGSVFWRDRSADDGEPIGGDPDVADLRSNPRVLAAFAQLRALPSVSLRITPAFRRTPRATVRADRVVIEDHLDLPGLDVAVRYLRHIDLILLAELAPHHSQIPELYEAYGRRAASKAVPLPDFLGALSTLVGLDVLTIA